MSKLQYMHEVKLIDATGKYFEVAFGYDYIDGNSQSYFSVSTQNGQDKFKPANENQERLLELWDKYHLTPISEGLETITTIILDELQQELEDDWNSKTTVTNMPIDYLKEWVDSECYDVESGYEYHAIAIAIHCDCTLEEMKEISNNSNYFTCQGNDYIVATDEEADDLEREYVEEVIDDCYLAEYIAEERKSRRSNPLLTYLDKDKWIDDWCGNRGENLASYDGQEHEIKIGDEWYYIYKR